MPGETSGEVMLLRRREEKEPVAFGNQSGFAWPVSPLARPVPLRGRRAVERLKIRFTLKSGEPAER